MFAGKIIDSGGHYLILVKDNQSELMATIAAEFRAGFPPYTQLQHEAFCQIAEASTKGHGRLAHYRL